MNTTGTHTDNGAHEEALHSIREQLTAAVAARKCHPCGCLHQTVDVLAGTAIGRETLASILAEARQVFQAKAYDCLGCPVCYPAMAANAFAEAFPDMGEELDLCPTAAPEERMGWPPLPGDYQVVRYQAPVAVCTLNSYDLAVQLAQRAPEGLAIVGTLHTENLGIERLIRNVVANPHLRFLILCGPDTQQAIGHLPGQSLASLFSEGLDERGRIRGARGKRPVLKNVRPDHVESFLRQIELVEHIGEEELHRIYASIDACVARNPGPVTALPVDTGVVTVQAIEPQRLMPDAAGFFVVYPDSHRQLLIVEHYTTAGGLDCVIEGRTSAAVYSAAIERQLVSRLDHAAYLGRELARAELSLKTGEAYVQDRAPGELSPALTDRAHPCGCGDAECASIIK
jgi:tetrahydromethanopterin S-methyltransferase subunit A